MMSQLDSQRWQHLQPTAWSGLAQRSRWGLLQPEALNCAFEILLTRLQPLFVSCNTAFPKGRHQLPARSSGCPNADAPPGGEAAHLTRSVWLD